MRRIKKKKKWTLANDRQSETEEKEPLCITLNNNELDLDIGNSQHSETVAKLVNEYKPITLKETKVHYSQRQIYP